MTKEESFNRLKNTKVYVGEMRKEVVSKLIDLGLTKISNDLNINIIDDAEFIYIFDGRTFEVGKNIYFFFEHKYRQITRSEILDIQIDEEFKDGDVLASDSGNPFIFNGKYDLNGGMYYHVGVDSDDKLRVYSGFTWTIAKVHLATKEESAKLFKALFDACKRWNAKKKCVENLPKEFKPFDKVLCRDRNDQNWACDLYSHKEDDLYMTIGCYYKQCIPYEGNESLLGTNLSY